MTEYKKDDVLSETMKLRPAQPDPPPTIKVMTPDDFLRMLAGMNREADLEPPPLPTMESIRAEIESWKSGYAGQLTELTEDRFKLSTQTCSVGLMHALYSANMQPMLEWARRGNAGLPDDVAQALSGQEWVELTLARQWENVAVVCSLGILVGKMLADSSFTVEEIMRIAADPVFTLQVVTGRTTRMRVQELAINSLRELDALASAEGKKSAAGE